MGNYSPSDQPAVTYVVCHDCRLLAAEVAELRNTIKLIVGRKINVPWTQVLEGEVDGWLEEYRRLKKARAG